MNKRIEIVGLLGAGKTTLLNKMAAQNYNMHFIYEELSSLNEVWDFVRQTDANYFLLQAAYYIEAANKIQKALSAKCIISDFSLRVHHFVYSFYLFKHSFINQVEWNTLDKMFNLLSEQLPIIKKLIVINATPNELLQNISKRNRNLDSNTQLDYLIKLKECFDENKNKILLDIPAIIFDIPELMIDNQSVIEKLNKHIIN